MRYCILIFLYILIFFSCASQGTPTLQSDDAENNAIRLDTEDESISSSQEITVDTTEIISKAFSNITAVEVIDIFNLKGINIFGQPYKGEYKYYLNSKGEPILHGIFEIISKIKGEESDKHFHKIVYNGQFSHGIKNGTFTCDAKWYEGGSKSTLKFNKGDLYYKNVIRNSSEESYDITYKNPINDFESQTVEN